MRNHRIVEFTYEDGTKSFAIQCRFMFFFWYYHTTEDYGRSYWNTKEEAQSVIDEWEKKDERPKKIIH